MMYERRETEYYRAKMKAGRRICHGWVKQSDLPSNAEIRDEIQRMAWMFGGEARFDKLTEMRIEALRLMHLLQHCRPKIIGSTFTGHVRQGSDIDIHVFAANTDAVTSALDQEGMSYDVEHKHDVVAAFPPDKLPLRHEPTPPALVQPVPSLWQSQV